MALWPCAVSGAGWAAGLRFRLGRAVCRVSGRQISVSMVQIYHRHLYQTMQRFRSGFISLRPRSPPKLQLLALWGKIPPVCSDGGWISVNLQDLSAV